MAADHGKRESSTEELVAPSTAAGGAGGSGHPHALSPFQRFKVQFNKGEHGFDNEDMNMKTIFRAVGPAFKQGLVVEPFESVNVYPLLCQLLGITPEPHDGSLAIMEPMLRESAGTGTGRTLPLRVPAAGTGHWAPDTGHRAPGSGCALPHRARAMGTGTQHRPRFATLGTDYRALSTRQRAPAAGTGSRHGPRVAAQAPAPGFPREQRHLAASARHRRSPGTSSGSSPVPVAAC